MSKPRLYLRNFRNDEVSNFEFDGTESWIIDALERRNEPGTEGFSKSMPNKSAHLTINARKFDELYYLSGDFEGSICLVCSRCMTPFEFDLGSHFDRVCAMVKGLAVPIKDDSETVFLDSDFIDILPILEEHLDLQIPIQPLCKADCWGICQSCGADLNGKYAKSCQCKRDALNNPFGDLAQRVSFKK